MYLYAFASISIFGSNKVGAIYLPAERQIVALTQLVFKVQRRAAAFQAPPLQEGDAVAQHFGFVQVMGGHDDGAI